MAAVLVIRPTRSRWSAIDGKKLWRYRELVYHFTLRDLKLRYKQTALGAVWTVLQPLITTGVLSLLFGRIAKLPSDSVPYPLFCFAALLPWNYFANSLGRGATSLVANANLLSKIYFPRIIIPFASLMPGLVDFGIGLAVLIPLCLYYGYVPPLIAVVAVPALLALTLVAVLGVSLWFSSLNVRYRDVSNMLPFITQIWMFATPVIYPNSMVTGELRWLFALNPLVGIVAAFRAALFGTPCDFGALGLSVVVALMTLVSGVVVFSRMERTFADSV